jgi:hypothetical protein
MARSQSLFSIILAFVALAHAMRPSHSSIRPQQAASKGKDTHNYCISSDAAKLITNRSLRGSAVIAQMFEWNWDSVAAECTSFLGPAGYGFVQGEAKYRGDSPPSFLANVFPLSEPCAGTCPGFRMVDGLSARLVHPHVQTRQSIPVPEHDHYMSRGWRQGHSWQVEKKRALSPLFLAHTKSC